MGAELKNLQKILALTDGLPIEDTPIGLDSEVQATVREISFATDLRLDEAPLPPGATDAADIMCSAQERLLDKLSASPWSPHYYPQMLRVIRQRLRLPEYKQGADESREDWLERLVANVNPEEAESVHELKAGTVFVYDLNGYSKLQKAFNHAQRGVLEQNFQKLVAKVCERFGMSLLGRIAGDMAMFYMEDGEDPAINAKRCLAVMQYLSNPENFLETGVTQEELNNMGLGEYFKDGRCTASVGVKRVKKGEIQTAVVTGPEGSRLGSTVAGGKGLKAATMQQKKAAKGEYLVDNELMAFLQEHAAVLFDAGVKTVKIDGEAVELNRLEAGSIAKMKFEGLSFPDRPRSRFRAGEKVDGANLSLDELQALLMMASRVALPRNGLSIIRRCIGRKLANIARPETNALGLTMMAFAIGDSYDIHQYARFERHLLDELAGEGYEDFHMFKMDPPYFFVQTTALAEDPDGTHKKVKELSRKMKAHAESMDEPLRAGVSHSTSMVPVMYLDLDGSMEQDLAGDGVTQAALLVKQLEVDGEDGAMMISSSYALAARVRGEHVPIGIAGKGRQLAGMKAQIDADFEFGTRELIGRPSVEAVWEKIEAALIDAGKVAIKFTPALNPKYRNIDELGVEASLRLLAAGGYGCSAEQRRLEDFIEVREDVGLNRIAPMEGAREAALMKSLIGQLAPLLRVDVPLNNLAEMDFTTFRWACQSFRDALRTAHPLTEPTFFSLQADEIDPEQGALLQALMPELVKLNVYLVHTLPVNGDLTLEEKILGQDDKSMASNILQYCGGLKDEDARDALFYELKKALGTPTMAAFFRGAPRTARTAAKLFDHLLIDEVGVHEFDFSKVDESWTPEVSFEHLDEIHVPRGAYGVRIDRELTSASARWLLYCFAQNRSAVTSEQIKQLYAVRGASGPDMFDGDLALLLERGFVEEGGGLFALTPSVPRDLVRFHLYPEGGHAEAVSQVVLGGMDLNTLLDGDIELTPESVETYLELYEHLLNTKKHAEIVACAQPLLHFYLEQGFTSAAAGVVIQCATAVGPARLVEFNSTFALTAADVLINTKKPLNRAMAEELLTASDQENPYVDWLQNVRLHLLAPRAGRNSATFHADNYDKIKAHYDGLGDGPFRLATAQALASTAVSMARFGDASHLKEALGYMEAWGGDTRANFATTFEKLIYINAARIRANAQMELAAFRAGAGDIDKADKLLESSREAYDQLLVELPEGKQKRDAQHGLLRSATCALDSAMKAMGVSPNSQGMAHRLDGVVLDARLFPKEIKNFRAKAMELYHMARAAGDAKMRKDAVGEVLNVCVAALLGEYFDCHGYHGLSDEYFQLLQEALREYEALVPGAGDTMTIIRDNMVIIYDMIGARAAEAPTRAVHNPVPPQYGPLPDEEDSGGFTARELETYSFTPVPRVPRRGAQPRRPSPFDRDEGRPGGPMSAK